MTIGLNSLAAAAAAAPLSESALSSRKRSIAPIAAAAAVGDMSQLKLVLDRGLDAGFTVSEVKEVLIQLYAYAGFPRSLNALGELMKVLEARWQRGVHDLAGREPSQVPVGEQLLALGTATQTQLFGGPVKGPLFEIAPGADAFLKTHLFGDIFARDNLAWQSRELATVGALAAMQGVESQLFAHVGASINIGITPAQLLLSADALVAVGYADAAKRTRAELERHLAWPHK
ncbi:carboxymuconolactone decarboxylase family protein [Paucibacter sp. PLA-PC-4]|uniref:carboxymuconolactone decarboxylase family protein n=1 Tax=Paucibacter sp. PLA-PC-4 TaxID=2993655 RepID=UPI00224A8A6C|nr:carboxymuconolactone decarboxylase family protein [Paucibacter sp. PLA-PC-4]MCX2864709.1 carboxymuconolactone decarboxylase family protein [Paucibacter sp. PLA-PC-4]